MMNSMWFKQQDRITILKTSLDSDYHENYIQIWGKSFYHECGITVHIMNSEYPRCYNLVITHEVSKNLVNAWCILLEDNPSLILSTSFKPIKIPNNIGELDAVYALRNT